jgi:hypothetical protein
MPCDLSALVGNWSVTTFACGSNPAQALPQGVTFTLTVGPAPSYVSTQVTNAGLCTGTDVGVTACDGTYMGLPAFTLQPTQPTQCTPANCASMNVCGATPSAPSMTFVVTGTAPNRKMITVTLPGTPLMTCTILGQPNPITFTWVQQ